MEQEKGLSKEEKAKLKAARCKQLAEDFIMVLQRDGLMALFAEAGSKIRKMQSQWAVMDTLTEQLEKADEDVERERLHALLKEAEKKWDAMHEYDTFSEKGEEQWRFLRAQDYDDRVSDNLRRFYCCPHCGVYFFSKFWTKRGRPWYCELNYSKWCELADPEHVKKVKEAWGDDPLTWQRVGCGKVYQPWAWGQGMVIEYRSVTSGEWQAFRADLIPEVLDDSIKKRQVEFNKSMQALTPDAVYDLIPRTYPKVNPVELAGFDAFPGVGHFDLKRWGQENQPVLTTVGWLKLAIKVAENDLENLVDVFNVARTELARLTRKA